MEKRQYKDYYLPFAQSKLLGSQELVKEILAPTGNYRKPLGEQKIFFKLFSKILQAGEASLGPVLSSNNIDFESPIPVKWLPIVNYLKNIKILEDIQFSPSYFDEPRLIRADVDYLLSTDLTDGILPKKKFCYSNSLDVDQTLAKVIGEFLERYTLIIYREKNLIKTSLLNLQRDDKLFLNIRSLASFSQKQKQNRPSFQFNDHSLFLWTEGKSLFDRQTVLLPAQLTFWNYKHRHQDWPEPILRESNSNGASGHYTLNQAILAGLYELIQRDGFLIYWLNKQGPPQIDIKTIDYEPLNYLLAECNYLNFEVRFYNTTTDIGVPSCICIVFDHSGYGPKISFGGDCGYNWDKILLGSLQEAFATYSYLRRLKTEMGENYTVLDENYRPFQDTINQMNRLTLWANPEMYKHITFFLAGKFESLTEIRTRYPCFISPDEEFNYLTQKFKSFGDGYEIYYYQAKHQALDDLGYFSVKVIVPALVPLYLNEHYAPLGSSRLKLVPTKLGFSVASEWNRWPHPFP